MPGISNRYFYFSAVRCDSDKNQGILRKLWWYLRKYGTVNLNFYGRSSIVHKQFVRGGFFEKQPIYQIYLSVIFFRAWRDRGVFAAFLSAVCYYTHLSGKRQRIYFRNIQEWYCCGGQQHKETSFFRSENFDLRRKSDGVSAEWQFFWSELFSADW